MNVHASTPHCEAAAQIVGPHSVLRSWAAFRTADQLFCRAVYQRFEPSSAHKLFIRASPRPNNLGCTPSPKAGPHLEPRVSFVLEPRVSCRATLGPSSSLFVCPHCCTDISKKLDHNPYPEAGPPRVPVGPNSVPSPLPSCAKQSELHMRRETALFLTPFGFID